MMLIICSICNGVIYQLLTVLAQLTGTFLTEELATLVHLATSAYAIAPWLAAHVLWCLTKL